MGAGSSLVPSQGPAQQDLKFCVAILKKNSKLIYFVLFYKEIIQAYILAKTSQIISELS